MVHYIAIDQLMMFVEWYLDRKSLSEGADYRISMETSKFQEIFKCCDFPKKLVYVNNGDEFRSRESIFDEVWKFIDN